MIRGRYSCLVEMEIEISENTPNLLPFAHIKRIVEQKMTHAVKGMLEEEFGDIGTISVYQNNAEVHLDKEADGNG